MYKYFCSFAFQTPTGDTLFSNDVVEVSDEIHSYDDILVIEKFLQKQHKFVSLPIIINYRRVYDK